MAEQYKSGINFTLDDGVTLGYGYGEGKEPSTFGDNCTIRSGTVIYSDVRCGDYFQTGHNVVIREKTRTGNHVIVGTNTVIDGNVEIGDFVKIESSCYIPTHVRIGSRVFIAPGVVLTNDKYPLKRRDEYRPDGPVIEDGVTLCAGVIVLPGVRIGRGSFVAAGALVTKDIPKNSFVIRTGEVREMPEKLSELNVALSWRQFIGG